ncbi:hypothetical protein MGSAQ_000192 [marine sediment metagenome]|uniref:Uncharacterized protein n=1 Tax=marine sediment metagenome TaxID=412755 RepID=A0A1B6NY31_9ZZZZ
MLVGCFQTWPNSLLNIASLLASTHQNQHCQLRFRLRCQDRSAWYARHLR